MAVVESRLRTGALLRRRSGIAAGLSACVLSCGLPAFAATIHVGAADNLQLALTTAQPGDTILLDPGTIYTGNFTLPLKGGDAPITLRSAATQGVPGDGVRVSPADAPQLPKLQSPNGLPVLQTAAGAHHWRLVLLELLANAKGAGDIVTLGDGSPAQRSLAQVPHDLVLDRIYIHGDALAGQKRAVALNSASTTITGSFIADVKSATQDSQAIGGWNGPGPYLISNNYLEASGENLAFGGADPAIAGLVPSDIAITGNQFAKQPAWRAERWVVKNLLELKNARRVSIAGNSFDYNWADAQAGYAVLFTVRNQDGGCPWCQVDHVTFERNSVRHSGGGISILGTDNNHPSQQTQSIVIRNNVFADIDDRAWGGNGAFLLLTGGPRDVTVDHNTIVQGTHAEAVVLVGGPAIPGFTFTNNLARHDTYGILGDNHGVGNDSIAAYLPASTITRNVLAGGSAARYPPGNSFPAAADFEGQFAGFASGDYRLKPESVWRGAGTDGLDLGAIFSVRRSQPPVRGALIPTSH